MNEICSTDDVRSIGVYCSTDAVRTVAVYCFAVHGLLYMNCCADIREEKQDLHTWQSCKTFAFCVCLGHLYLIDLHIFY